MTLAIWTLDWALSLTLDVGRGTLLPFPFRFALLVEGAHPFFLIL